MRVVEVPLSHKSLNSGDAFILDAGLKIYIWYGKKVGIAEKSRATNLSKAIDDERGGKPERYTLAEGDKDDHAKEFWTILGGEGEIGAAEGDDAEWEKKESRILFQFSDSTGKDVFTKKAEGKLAKTSLDAKDVFVVDYGNIVYVWIGKEASAGEKKKALSTAQKYLKEGGRPSWIPIAKVFQGSEPALFWIGFA